MSLTSRQFLSVYTVQVKKKFSQSEWSFDDLIESDEFDDFLAILEDFFNDLNRKKVIDKDKDTVLGIDKLLVEPKKRRISGFLNSGSYGVNGSVHNTVSNKVTSKISRDDAPMYNYYFSFYIPRQGKRGVLGLHSRGNHGCKATFHQALRTYLDKQDIRLSL